ncbi:MAG: peptide ABC transporter permease [Chloroflexi bacterium]|nr:MAG: peptide ABC transporter permease [Chloroflexota bacterium]
MASVGTSTPETTATLFSPNRVRRRTLRGVLAAAWKLRLSVAGATVLILLILMAIFAPLLTPYTTNEGSIRNRLQPPVWQEGGTWSHPLGTDGIGRDYATRLLYGARVALAVGLLATLISGVIGVFFGVIAGYFGGKIDTLISTLVNIMLTFPFILLALCIIAVLGSSFTNVVFVLGIGAWPIYTRVMKFEVERIKSLEYMSAARVIGLRNSRMIWRHVMPNLVNTIIVLGTVQVARLIIAEAFLSYLGLGIQPPTPTWGQMLQESIAFSFTWSDIWLPTLPGLAIFITTLSINFVGDGLRDLIDPRERAVL